MTRKNWIVDCIEKRALTVRMGDGTRIVNCDASNLETIRRVAAIVTETRAVAPILRRETLPLTGPSLPTPLFAGLAGAYQLLDDKKTGVVVLVTQDGRLAQAARDLIIRIAGQESRIEDIFAIGHIHNNSLSTQAFARAGIKLDRFRLVIAERFDADDRATLERNGVHVALVLFDGRTRKPDRTFTEASGQTPAPGTYIFLTPSAKLVVDGFPAVSAWPDARMPLHPAQGAVPMLVTPPRPELKLRAHRVELDTRHLLADIMAIKDNADPVISHFFQDALSTYNALLGAPVHPSELDPVYRGTGREHVHPIHDSLETLAYYQRVADARRLPGATLMPIITGGLRDLAQALDERSPKRDLLLLTIRGAGSARIVVSDPSSARALRKVLKDENITGDVTAWTDPVTWAPEERPVILAAPMPRGREWVPTIELGADVRFLMTPEEAARTERSLERYGIKAGAGLAPLRRIMAGVPQLPTPVDHPPTEQELGTLLDAGVLLAAAGDKELRRSIGMSAIEHGIDPSTDTAMIELVLDRARVFRTFPHSMLTAIMGGTARRLSVDEATDWIANDRGPLFVVLSDASLDEDLQSAAFRVWENRPKNQGLRALAQSWKDGLIKRIGQEGWSAKKICTELSRAGVSLRPEQAREIFIESSQMAAYDKEESLVKASLELGGVAATSSRIAEHVDAIRRIRGIHRAAGRWANDLGKATYLEADDDLVREAKDDHGIDIAALRRHFFVARVEAIRGQRMLPTAFLGLHPDTHGVIP